MARGIYLISILLLSIGLFGCGKEDAPDIYKDSFYDYEGSKEEKEEVAETQINDKAEPISIKVIKMNYAYINYFTIDIETNLPEGSQINLAAVNEEGETMFEGFGIVEADGTDIVDMNNVEYDGYDEGPRGTYTLEADMLALSWTDADYDLWDAYGDAESAEKLVGNDGTVISKDDESYHIYLWDIAKLEFPKDKGPEEMAAELEQELPQMLKALIEETGLEYYSQIIVKGSTGDVYVDVEFHASESGYSNEEIIQLIPKGINEENVNIIFDTKIIYTIYEGEHLATEYY